MYIMEIEKFSSRLIISKPQIGKFPERNTKIAGTVVCDFYNTFTNTKVPDIRVIY